MKLVKDKVVKFPRVSGRVEGTLKRALYAAKELKYRKVLIVGEDAGGTVFINHSNASEKDLLFLCEIAKRLVVE